MTTKNADEIGDGIREEIVRLRARADALEVAESALLGVEIPAALTVDQITAQRDEARAQAAALAADLAAASQEILRMSGEDREFVTIPVATLNELRIELEARRTAAPHDTPTEGAVIVRDDPVPSVDTPGDAPASDTGAEWTRKLCPECRMLHPPGACAAGGGA